MFYFTVYKLRKKSGRRTSQRMSGDNSKGRRENGPGNRVQQEIQ